MRHDPKKVCRIKVSEIERQLFRERTGVAIYAVGIIGCIVLLCLIMVKWL